MPQVEADGCGGRRGPLRDRLGSPRDGEPGGGDPRAVGPDQVRRLALDCQGGRRVGLDRQSRRLRPVARHGRPQAELGGLRRKLAAGELGADGDGRALDDVGPALRARDRGTGRRRGLVDARLRGGRDAAERHGQPRGLPPRCLLGHEPGDQLPWQLASDLEGHGDRRCRVRAHGQFGLRVGHGVAAGVALEDDELRRAEHGSNDGTDPALAHPMACLDLGEPQSPAARPCRRVRWTAQAERDLLRPRQRERGRRDLHVLAGDDHLAITLAAYEAVEPGGDPGGLGPVARHGQCLGPRRGPRGHDAKVERARARADAQGDLDLEALLLDDLAALAFPAESDPRHARVVGVLGLAGEGDEASRLALGQAAVLLRSLGHQQEPGVSDLRHQAEPAAARQRLPVLLLRAGLAGNGQLPVEPWQRLEQRLGLRRARAADLDDRPHGLARQVVSRLRRPRGELEEHAPALEGARLPLRGLPRRAQRPRVAARARDAEHLDQAVPVGRALCRVLRRGVRVDAVGLEICGCAVARELDGTRPAGREPEQDELRDRRVGLPSQVLVHVHLGVVGQIAEDLEEDVNDLNGLADDGMELPAPARHLDHPLAIALGRAEQGADAALGLQEDRLEARAADVDGLGGVEDALPAAAARIDVVRAVAQEDHERGAIAGEDAGLD